MTGPAEQIGIGRALARLALAKAFKTTAVFTHRGAASVTLAIETVANWNELVDDERGVLTESRRLKIRVAANQTGFQASASDTEPVIPGDTFVISKYSNRTYQVLAPIQLDASGRVYILILEENKRLGSGVG